MNKSPLSTLCGTLLVFAIATTAMGQAETVWRGPNRDGIYPEKGLLSSWPANGPKMVVTIEGVGTGFSSPAVTAKRIYVTGMIDSTGYLFAYDKTGRLLWKVAYGQEWHSSYAGSRGTPLVANGRIYVESGKGRVACFSAVDGKNVWAVDMGKAFGAKATKWGHAETMLLNGKHLICTPGGTKASIAALDAATGKTVWTVKAGGQPSGYCSPVIVQHGKRPILVTMLAASVVGVDPASGTLLWQHPHPTEHGVNPNTPLYTDGRLVYFSGYGEGAGMLELSADGTKITRGWRQPAFDVRMGGGVLLGNTLYGSGQTNQGWHALDITSGTITHTTRTFGGGCVISAEGLLYCYSEKGTLALVKPGAKGLSVVSKCRIPKGQGPHWAHPVIDDGRLYVRHGDVLMVYDIRG